MKQKGKSRLQTSPAGVVAQKLQYLVVATFTLRRSKFVVRAIFVNYDERDFARFYQIRVKLA